MFYFIIFVFLVLNTFKYFYLLLSLYLCMYLIYGCVFYTLSCVIRMKNKIEVLPKRKEKKHFKR